MSSDELSTRAVRPPRTNLLADTDHTVHWNINGSLQNKLAYAAYLPAAQKITYRVARRIA